MHVIKRASCPGNLKYLSSLLPFIFIFLSLLFFSSCGKKGAPTLKSYEKPEQPSLLRAIHREDKIILLWNFPKSKENLLEGFILLKSSDAGFQKYSTLEKQARSYIETDFKEGIRYSYKIVSQNLRGIYSDDSNVINLTPLKAPTPPERPSFRTDGDGLNIIWGKGEKEGLYNIYKSYEKGAYGLYPLNTAPLTESSFKDTFDTTKPVYYTVRSLTDSEIRDEGYPSEELVVNPFEFVPSPPGDLQFFAAPDRVYLSWKEPAERWVTGFKVYRRIGNQDYVLIGETQIPAFLDKEKPATKRDYRVSATGPGKEGPAAEITGIVFIPAK